MTLMYGVEVTWRGQRKMEASFRKSINRMERPALGVLPPTPVAFLQAEGGFAPAAVRLGRRQGGLRREIVFRAAVRSSAATRH